jgi:hypothetical protein
LLPEWDLTLGEGEGCLREPHDGPHINLMSDGSYVVWESDYGCTTCEVGDDCECIVWKKAKTLDGAEQVLQNWGNA